MDGFTNKLPDSEGWWLFLEEGEDEPEVLYIVGDEEHVEIATDDILADKLGAETHEETNEIWKDGILITNWWEMTACKEMYGLWKKKPKKSN